MKNHEPHAERQPIAEQIEDCARRSGVSESLEDAFGHEGDIRAMLDRGAAQRRLDEACRPGPQTD